MYKVYWTVWFLLVCKKWNTYSINFYLIVLLAPPNYSYFAPKSVSISIFFASDIFSGTSLAECSMKCLAIGFVAKKIVLNQYSIKWTFFKNYALKYYIQINLQIIVIFSKTNFGVVKQFWAILSNFEQFIVYNYQSIVNLLFFFIIVNGTPGQWWKNSTLENRVYLKSADMNWNRLFSYHVLKDGIGLTWKYDFFILYPSLSILSKCNTNGTCRRTAFLWNPNSPNYQCQLFVIPPESYTNFTTTSTNKIYVKMSKQKCQ